MSVAADKAPTAQSSGSGLSFIWIVPLVAALIAGWLVWQGLIATGEDFEIVFDSASGIEVGQTAIVYRGVTVGQVTDVRLDRDLDKVIVSAQLRPDAAVKLTDGTRFWLVRPRLSLSGVSGLETLLRGQYIALEPGPGEPTDRFIAEDRPQLASDRNGLRMTLTAATLGSVGVGSAIYYRQIPVGQVLGHQLSEDSKRVEIDIHIEAGYRQLVRKNSRFWNASGLSVKGGISGLQVDIESLEALLIGGIAFDTPDTAGPPLPASSGDRFPLYENYEAAEVGLAATIRFDSGKGLKAGETRVRVNGIDVGVVKELSYRPDLTGVLALVYFDPRFESLLNTGSRFWLVRPAFGIEGITGLDTVLGGQYIAGQPGQGVPTRRFIALPEAPGRPVDAPGLRLNLKTDRVGGLRQGAKVTYRDVEIGQVEAISLDDQFGSVLLSVHIESEYVPLVHRDSRFWRRAAFDVRGGPDGLDLQISNLKTMLAGGIAMDAPPSTNKTLLESGARFPLFDDFGEANSDGALFKRDDGSLSVQLHSADIRVGRGAPVYHRGVQVGVVERNYLKGDQGVTDLRIDPAHSKRVRVNSRFWQRAGVEMSADWDGVKLSSGPLGMLLFGGIEFSVPEGLPPGKAARNGADFELFADRSGEQASDSQSAARVAVSLRADELGGLRRGAPILFRGIEVGDIQSIALQPDGKALFVEAALEQRYQHLLEEGLRFWHASGIRVSASLQGIDLEVGSAKTLLAGGLAMDVIPGAATAGRQGDRYRVYADRDAAEYGRVLARLLLDEAGGLKPGSDIRIRGVSVGSVDRVGLLKQGVVITMAVHEYAAASLREGSMFTVVDAKVGLSGVEEIGTLLSGPYIALTPGVGKKQKRFDQRGRNLPKGLLVRLDADRLGSIQPGNPVYYRQVVVGEIHDVALSELSDAVVIMAMIKPRYTPLVRQNSRFWNVSGLKVDFGLVSGLKVDAESLQSLLAGGVAFGTPGGQDAEGLVLEPGAQVAPGTAFRLYEKVDPRWLNWAPIIPLGPLAESLTPAR